MSGYEWVVHAGRSWQVHHTDLEPDQAGLSITFDYGTADEPPAELGTLTLLAAHLRAELQRPVEVGPGQVSVPDVDTLLAATTTTLVVRGRRRAVLAAWDRLGELFASPQLSAAVQPVQAPSRIWPGNLATYTGLTADTLANMRVRTTRDPAAAERLLTHLAPAACQVRHVLGASDPYLVGAGWAGTPDYGTAPIRPARYHDLRPALVPSDDRRVILSVAAPPGVNALAGSHAIVIRVFEIMREIGIGDSLTAQAVHLRDLSIYTICADNDLAPVQLRRVADQLLQPDLPLPDALVHNALDDLSEVEVSMMDRDLRMRGKDLTGAPLAPAAPAWPVAQPSADLDAELAALADGSLPAASPAPAPAASQDPVSARPTAEAVRAAFTALLRSVHVPQISATDSLAQAHGMIEWDPPAMPQGATVTLEGFDPLNPRERHPHVVRMNDEVLYGVWFEWERGPHGQWEVRDPIVMRWLDMRALRMGVTREDGYVTLIDDRLRHVTFPWAALNADPQAAALLERRGARELPWFAAAD